MPYVIKDNKYHNWLKIDRIVDDCEIITCVEPVYNYKAATQFSNEGIADAMIEQIKSEGQYETDGYVKENTEDLKAKEEEIEQEEVEAAKEFIESKKKELEDELRKQGKSEEVIKKALESFGSYMPDFEESE